MRCAAIHHRLNGVFASAGRSSEPGHFRVDESRTTVPFDMRCVRRHATSTLRSVFGCVLVTVASGALAGCKGGAPSSGGESLPALDDALAAQGVEALNGAPPEARSELAMKFLVELEGARLGAEFVEGWEALGKAPPSLRGRIAAEAINDNVGMLDAACEVSGAEAMRKVAEVAPAEKSAKIYELCNFGRHGLVDDAAIAQVEPLAMVLAHMAFAHIEAHGDVSDDERTLLRAAATMAAAPFDAQPVE